MGLGHPSARIDNLDILSVDGKLMRHQPIPENITHHLHDIVNLPDTMNARFSKLRHLVIAVAALAIASLNAAEKPATDGGWISLFNGKDLDGWTVKIAKHPLGDNYADTFRVEDGIMKVAYDKYGKFDGQFGHIYSNLAYSHYVLRLEYRFTGTAVADAPPWAKLNSGVMIHSQSPLTMTVEQAFPVSMEVQFLSIGSGGGQQTGNACTPGTNLERNGVLTTDHIIEATGENSPIDQWVTAEVEVRGNEEVIHRINGVEVLRYQRPQLDPSDPDAQRLLALGAPMQLSSGHIALQAESQPVWFRKIEIRPLSQ